ncbi:hypothetical protein SAMN05720465_1972 [Fibrobacter sp. UWB10]|nr:hypothetical protein SAMN05720465_1972 [Fibrobacter sp. UWB10]
MKLRDWTLTIIFMAALQVSAFAVDREPGQGSVIGGDVSGFLKKDRSPYLVKETLVVPEGKALIVEAGTVLYFSAGTGIDVRGGSLAVMGENANPVLMTSAEDGALWNGVSITGVKPSEIQGTHLKNAVYGYSVESGSLEVRDGIISNVERAAVYVRNGSFDMQWSKIEKCPNVGVWAVQDAAVDIDASTLSGNNIAIVAGEGSSVNLKRSQLNVNEVAVLDFGDNDFKQRNSTIEGNEIGYVSADIPPQNVRPALENNQKLFSSNVEDYFDQLREHPNNPYANTMKFSALQKETVDSSWNVSGNVGIEIGYHKVMTRHNSSGKTYESQGDSVLPGERYINYFQVPGFFTNINANLLMKSPTGATFEFVADVSSDAWDNFKIYQLQASYTDDMQRLVLGDFYANGGDLYLAGVSAFGASYDINLMKRTAYDPMFVGSVFAGEVRAPKLPGKRNYDVYKDYIDDGEAEAQRMVAGGKVRWNMHRRFNGTLGFIGSKDYVEDPFLRDGMDANTNTMNPVISSRNIFADGNWLFYPGDIKLNGQIAMGAADTANAAKIRAINQVFSEAGLDASNFALLNKLMNNVNEVNSLSRSQLESIFGENSMMTPTEMRAELKRLLAKASDVAKGIHTDDVSPASGDFWGHEHLAFSGAYQWSNSKTFVEGFFRYVGSEYYSAGSDGLLQNTRMIGGNLKHKVYEFWDLGFGYTMNVENAAGQGDDYNVFGLGEGTQLGLTGAESGWLKEHEQDPVRTLYIHDGYLKNDFKLNEKMGLSFKYSFNYRTRNTPQRLYANYSASSGIYNDPWFKEIPGRSTFEVADSLDTVVIDSIRWANYYALSNEEYLATQFEEKLMKHTLELGWSYKMSKNMLKLGTALIVFKDMSDFVQKDKISRFSFTNETYGILGYYFHGSDYLEQRFPMSLTTSFEGFKNTMALTPRYKLYNRNDMSEFEWNFMDNMDITICPKLLELSMGGGIRQNFLSYEIDDTDYDEMELDIDASTKLRVHHSQSLYSDWTVGVLFNYRPDNKADQYKDFYIIAALNYDF